MTANNNCLILSPLVCNYDSFFLKHCQWLMRYSRSRCSRCSRSSALICGRLAITQDGDKSAKPGRPVASVDGGGGWGRMGAQIGPSYAGMLLCSLACESGERRRGLCVCVCVCACSSLFFLMVSRWGQREAANLSHQVWRIWAKLIHRGLGAAPRSGPNLCNAGAVTALDGFSLSSGASWRSFPVL